MNEMNIFIFQPYPKFGGADRSIIRMINSNNDANFTLISITKCKYKKYLNKKIKYIQLKSSRTFSSIFNLRKNVKKLISKFKDKKNIFISNQNFANIITILSLKNLENLKIILIERNHLNELYNYKNIFDFLKKKIILFLIKFTYREADSIVGISKTLSKDLSRFIKKEVTTIYNPAMDNEIYKDISYKFNLPKKIVKKKIILNVGFYEIQKDQITILKALNLLIKESDQYHLLLVGRGSLFGHLDKFVKENKLSKHVSFMQKIDNPSELYKVADLFILSSRYEGFGNVIVESLKNKCPVITSNCCSGPMEIIGYGKYGDYFNVGDYMSLKKKITNFFYNKIVLKQKTLKAKTHLKKFSLLQNKIAFKKLFDNI